MVSPDRYAATARAAARAILSAPPFEAHRGPPGTLQRVADDVGHAITAVVRWIADRLHQSVFHPVSHAAHAALGPWANVGLVAVVAALVAAGAFAWTRRSRPGEEPEGTVSGAARARRTAELMELATRARASGDLDRALRLRFEAGLERLEDRGVLEDRRALTTGAVAARLGSTRFDELAAAHSLVAYAGQPATPDDVELAFREWPEVAEHAGRGAR